MTYVPTTRKPTGIPAAPLIMSCSVLGCDRPHMARGFCRIHYDRSRRGTDMQAPVRSQQRSDTCRAEGCEQRPKAKSALCSVHGNVQYRYGLTPEQLELLLAAQRGLCAACGELLASRWVVDHDHACCAGRGATCGQCVRGIICARCNLALGHARESRATLQALIDYIDRWEGAQ